MSPKETPNVAGFRQDTGAVPWPAEEDKHAEVETARGAGDGANEGVDAFDAAALGPRMRQKPVVLKCGGAVVVMVFSGR